MARFSDTLKDQYGRGICGALVSVTHSDTGLPAVLTYDDGSAEANPLTTEVDGTYYFNADNGAYDLIFHYGGRVIGEKFNIFVGDVSLLPEGSVVDSLSPSEPNIAPSQNAVNAALALKVSSADLSASTGSSLIGFRQDGSGAVTRSAQAKMREIVSVQDFGAIGDNSSDDYAAIQAAINYCVSKRFRLYFPEGSYVSSQQFVFTGTCDVVSDNTAAIRFTNGSSCGILLDLEDDDDTLSVIQFPQIYSPAIDSSFEIPGYNAADGWDYNPATRIGIAIHVKGANRIHLHAHYIVGFSEGVRIEPMPDVVSANIKIFVGVVDFCEKGFSFAASQVGSAAISEVEVHANTVWAKYPISFDPTNCIITGVKVMINGGTYVNESDGCTIWQDCEDAAGKMANIEVVSPRNAAGAGADSPAGTPAGLVNPFLGGLVSSNGQTTDGNATVGYWNANFCRFDIGPVMDAVGGASASGIPQAGDTIRIRDAGRNEVNMMFSRNVSAAAVPTEITPTPTEASYNGGVGGAQYAKQVLCSALVPSLAAGENSALQYVYYQLISAGMGKQIRLTPVGTALSDQGLMMWAQDDGASENRRIKIGFANPSATRVTTETTVFFWLEVG